MTIVGLSMICTGTLTINATMYNNAHDGHHRFSVLLVCIQPHWRGLALLQLLARRLRAHGPQWPWNALDCLPYISEKQSNDDCCPSCCFLLALRCTYLPMKSSSLVSLMCLICKSGFLLDQYHLSSLHAFNVLEYDI